MRELQEGTRLAARYTLVRQLGAGGMAEIWLANDRQADSTVALKFLRQSLIDKPAYRDLLHKEWQIGSRLMHAHIVRVFEFHDDPDGAYYSMQYIGGPSMSVLAGSNPNFALRPIGLIADALRYAHAKDVVHRDVKASNVLFDRRGAPYLIDFGVASVAAAHATGGSDIALSPQQRAGDAPQAADDIYSLGVLVTELISGAPPVADPDAAATVQLQSPQGDEISGELQSLLSEMLAVDAARRPIAEDVASRLSAAGIPPGPAAASIISPYFTADSDIAADPIESIQPLRRAAATGPEVVTDSGPGGISPKMLLSGLGVSLALFLVVIFLLPLMLQDDDPASGPGDVEVESQGAETIADEDTETSTDDGDKDEYALPSASGSDAGKDNAGFSENVRDFSGDTDAQVKFATDEALGDLLSGLERLKYRAIERWGGQPYLDAIDVYEEGDRAYLSRDYRLAYQRYRRAIDMLDPFFDRIDQVFEETMQAAQEAFDNGDHSEAVRLFDLAAAITPGNALADAGLARALSLESVLRLMDQGLRFEDDLELVAARLAFEKALEFDPKWHPATVALARIEEAIRLLSFEQRMTEGLDALAAGAFETAKAAFNAAKALDPKSRQPADGLLQVDQEIRLANIRRLDTQAQNLDQNEEWETAIDVYRDILEIDSDLQFAQEGLIRAQSRAELHSTLQSYIGNPDALSRPVTMQQATNVLLGLARVSPMGPRLEDQKNQLSRLLKRAATPLQVMLVSDSATTVSVYQIGRLGSFSTHELNLLPGVYVATGSRPGYRDVRLEFRVAPEVEMKPIIVQCEEQI